MKKIKKEILARAFPALLVVFPALGELLGSQEILTARSWLGVESDTSLILVLGQILGGSMLFFRKMAAVGALFCAITLSGAFPVHFFDLGFEGEMGFLFGLSLVGFLISSWIAFSFRKELPIIGRFFSR